MTDSPTAADLAQSCLRHMAAKDFDALRALFADDAAWELAFPLDGVSGDAQTVRGRG